MNLQSLSFNYFEFTPLAVTGLLCFAPLQAHQGEVQVTLVAGLKGLQCYADSEGEICGPGRRPRCQAMNSRPDQLY